MLTKRILLLIGALAILSAGVIGVIAYFTKKIIQNFGVLEREIIEEAATIKEESVSTDLEEKIITYVPRKEDGLKIFNQIIAPLKFIE